MYLRNYSDMCDNVKNTLETLCCIRVVCLKTT